MTTLDDYPELSAPAEPRAPTGVPTERPHRHRWVLITEPGGPWFNPLRVVYRCERCARTRGEASQRGRRNRARGNEIEREVCRKLGIRRVGQYGGPEDGGGQADWMVVQVKSGGAYPERIDRLLRQLSANANQLRAVVHVDTPGPGYRRRALITLELDDFVSWFGRPGR